MKYFIKYLPVPGKPEVGDTSFWDDNEGYFANQFFRVSTSNVSHSCAMGRKKYKPFLCTRDIKVGDEIRIYENPIEELAVLEFAQDDTPIVDRNGFRTHTNGAFKIIRELSSQAKWLKDEDEIKQEDLGPILYRDDEGNLFKSPEAAAWDGYTGEYTEVQTIKCPCCETFK